MLHIRTRAYSHKSFVPNFIADSVRDIDFGYLKAKGIKAIFLDLDGTVVARGTYDVHSKLSEVLKSQSLDIYIATNRPASRDLRDLKELLNASGVVHPKSVLGKPFRQYFMNALKTVSLKPEEVVMIGDRYIQDIFGANNAGIWSLVVRKLDKPTNPFDWCISSTERVFTTLLQRRYAAKSIGD